MSTVININDLPDLALINVLSFVPQCYAFLIDRVCKLWRVHNASHCVHLYLIGILALGDTRMAALTLGCTEESIVMVLDDMMRTAYTRRRVTYKEALHTKMVPVGIHYLVHLTYAAFRCCNIPLALYTVDMVSSDVDLGVVAVQSGDAGLLDLAISKEHLINNDNCYEEIFKLAEDDQIAPMLGCLLNWRKYPINYDRALHLLHNGLFSMLRKFDVDWPDHANFLYHIPEDVRFKDLIWFLNEARLRLHDAIFMLILNPSPVFYTLKRYHQWTKTTITFKLLDSLYGEDQEMINKFHSDLNRLVDDEAANVASNVGADLGIIKTVITQFPKNFEAGWDNIDLLTNATSREIFCWAYNHGFRAVIESDYLRFLELLSDEDRERLKKITINLDRYVGSQDLNTY